jgi:oxygen-independent coproporphyrinogen III oxidase
MVMQAFSVYIHIPFCQVRCNFCNLHAYGMGDYATLPELRRRYAHAVALEVERWAERVGSSRAPTVFFGGGTPTELSVDELGLILNAVRTHFWVGDEAEITVEGYPGLSPATVDGLGRLGVTRLSMGVQTFEPTLLQLLERTHTGREVAETAAAARAAGMGVALDLIYGLPGQTMAQWESSLEQAVTLGPDHLSLYALSISEATRLRARIARGELPALSDDVAVEMYRAAQRELEAAGYRQYELSNWARPGHECRHNQVYWRNEPWLGMGAGAYGWINQRRYTNIASPTRYVDAVEAGALPIGDEEVIDRHTEMDETVMLGLRLLGGLDLVGFEQRFGQRLEDAYAGKVNDLRRWGMLEVEGERLRLTNQALLVSNEVLAQLLHR